MSVFDNLFGNIKNLISVKLQRILLELSTGNADRDTAANKVTTKSVIFDKTADISVAQGEMAWNADEETVDIGLNGAVLQTGQEVHVHVRNNSGEEIANGKPVMATGTLGQSGRITIGLMDGTDTANGKLFGGITTEAISDDTDGKVTHVGKIRGIQTNGANYGEEWEDADLLWVSPTVVGALTNIPPSAPNIGLVCAIVISSHATQGTIFIRVNSIDRNFYTPYTISAPASDPTWIDVQTSLDDIAARLAVLEP